MEQNKTLIRERVEKELERLFQFPLTALPAPLGYGKTVAMHSFLENRGIRTVWVPLLDGGRSQEAFWDRLTAEAGKLDPAAAEQLARLGFPINAGQLDTLMAFAKSFDDGQPTVVVLDDYHLIEKNPRITELVERVAQEQIPNLHLVLLSRTLPQLNRIYLISKGLYYELDMTLLAFTQEETADYFSLMECPASPEDIQRACRCTGGWISAIYLLVLGVKRGIPMKEAADMNRLLEDNLFSTFDDETKEILMQLSELEHFTLPQAAEVLENPRAVGLIRRLAEENAFIMYDRFTGVYSIHSVFLSFLRQTARMKEYDRRPLCHRLGQWFFGQGNMVAAFDYYHRAGKIEELLEMLNSEDCVDIGFLGVQTQKSIAEELPLNACLRYPFPYLQFACDFILSGDEEAAALGIQIEQCMCGYFSKSKEVTERLRARILGELEVLRIYIDFNDVEKMAAHIARARELLGGKKSCIIFRENEFTYGLPHFIYAYYREAGKWKQTADCIINGFQPDLFDGCGTGCDSLALAEFALETGDAATAAVQAKKAIEKAHEKRQICTLLCAGFVRIRLHLLNREPQQALSLLTGMKRHFFQRSDELSGQNRAVFRTTLELIEGYLNGCLALPERIPEWLREGDFSEGTFMFNGLAFPCIITGKALMLTEHWKELLTQCEKFAELYGTFHNQLGLLHNAVYQAAASYHLYGEKAGCAVLLPALLDAQKDGIVMPFVENAGAVLPLLLKMADCADISREYLSRMTRLCRRYEKSVLEFKENSRMLSQRESEVLCFLEQGMTRQEMAASLYCSVSSIESCLESICSKLKVNSTAGAVEKAYELNIL